MGRLKHDDEPKTRHVRVRFSEREHLKLIERAQKQRLTVSELVRRTALSKREPKRAHDVVLDAGAFEIFQELRRQGVNLNQVAHHCNRHRVPPGPTFERLLQTIQAELDKLVPLLKSARR